MSTNTTAAKPALSPVAKKTLKTIFLTIFLDLVGFSIIFPLFPSLAKYYLSTNSADPLLRFVFGTIESLAALGGAATDAQKIVLFGGVLGAFYSLLQFLFAPIWGGLSDRIGRKPVLMTTIAGMAFSYVLWFVSGSFTLLVIARVVGGIMGGNISTATAVVSDVTDSSTRSRGMAIIGIAFGMGFIFGPAIGGMASLWDLTKTHPEWTAFGVNPFSGAALIACVLSLINLLQLVRTFDETLTAERRGQNEMARSSNPFKLFKPLPYPGVNRTNIGYFLFLTAFSGMEFTLTFLAAERFQYTPKQNAMMFVYVGLLIAFIQGGLVRRKAHDVGEKKFTLIGLVSVLPGLILIGLAQNQGLFYAGLALLAFGSASIVPCMTSLATLYAPSQVQGQVVGMFRSLGALARVVGPFTASIVYWRFGSTVPYLSGAAFLVVPMILVAGLPELPVTTQQ